LFPKWQVSVCLKSFSPCEPRYEKNITEKANECPVYYGHNNREQIRGWCIVTHKEIVKACGLFDEQFGFWYQDDDYGQTLKKAGYMHALMAKSHVQHIFGCSHSLLEDKLGEMTVGLKGAYNAKWVKSVQR
jgi:GT2 family glycosyltransferase